MLDRQLVKYWHCYVAPPSSKKGWDCKGREGRRRKTKIKDGVRVEVGLDVGKHRERGFDELMCEEAERDQGWDLLKRSLSC